MTSFQDDPSGKARATPSLLALLRGLGGQPQPPLDATAQLQAQIAREARLPRSGGLIGSAYARYMADDPQPQAATGTGAVFGPTATGIDSDQLVVDPADAYQVAGPPVAAHAAGASKADQQVIEAAQFAALKAYLSSPDVEGDRDHVYPDSRNFPTGGIGHKILPADRLRMGDPISKQQRDQWFEQDGGQALAAARAQAVRAGISDPDFVQPLASVNFQLGPDWWHGKTGFNKTWDLIMKRDYAGAADEVARSDWNKQTPARVQHFQAALRKLAARSQ